MVTADLGLVGDDEKLRCAGGHVCGEVGSAADVEGGVHLIAQEPRRAEGAVYRERQRERRERLLPAREVRECLPRAGIRPARRVAPFQLPCLEQRWVSDVAFQTTAAATTGLVRGR